MRRILRDVSSVLIISGLLLLVDAGVTLVWQEPVTAVVAMVKRAGIDRHLLSAQGSPLSAADQAALRALRSLRQRVSFLARREARMAVAGEAIGHLSISRIGASFDVVQGTDTGSLEKGPGHYSATALPGLSRTVAIAGHRTTYLAPFRHIDALEAGDRIVLTMPYGRFTYLVQGRRIVSPTSLWVIRDRGYDRLVLSACNPLYSAAQRIIVFARLAALEPAPEAKVAAAGRSRD